MTLSTRELLTLKGSYKPRSKFRNIPTTVDGIKFDSRAEARRYGELKLLERAGEIRDLELQPKFPIVWERSGAHLCTYIADFQYRDKDGSQVVEDVKSKATRTPLYRLKAKLMKAAWGVVIREVE